jgi:hypothetical protein
MVYGLKWVRAKRRVKFFGCRETEICGTVGSFRYPPVVNEGDFRKVFRFPMVKQEILNVFRWDHGPFGKTDVFSRGTMVPP